MKFDEIEVKIKRMREISSEVKEQLFDSPYDKNKLSDYLYGNGGDAHNGLFDVNATTDMCVNVTRQLIECTSRFLANAADTFEEKDYSIAKVVSEV